MTDIRFYHLQTQSVEDALPAIVSKAVATGRRILIRVADEGAVRLYDDRLWTYHPDSFLPHGAAGGGDEDLQPVLLSTGGDNHNGADMIVLCGIDTVPENIAQFTLCCDFIDGQNNESVSAGRARWSAYKQAGHALTYWQQTEKDGWEQKV
jgi:DNA polymerase-3 subunit chi